MAKKKQETPKAPSKGRKCLMLCPALLVGFVAVMLGGAPGSFMAVNDSLLILYTGARYWHEGIPVEQAWKDVFYLSVGFGRSPIFKHHIAKNEGIMQRQLLKVEPGDDHITAMCKVSMYTQLVTQAVFEDADPFSPPGIFNLDTFDPVPTAERINAYVQACKEVYAALDKDSPQRKILDGLKPEMKQLEITTPRNPKTSFSQIMNAKAERYKVASSRPSLNDRWKDPSEFDYGHMYRNSNIRPVKEEWINASEIPEAVRQGKVAVFDATKLLGKELFGLSMPEISALHGDMAKQIPMYRQLGASAPAGSGVETLELYAQKVKVWKQENSLRFPENAPFRKAGYSTMRDAADMADGTKQPVWWLEVLATILNPWFKLFVGADLGTMHRMMRQTVLQAAVNTRRLPKLPMPKIEDALGNPDWLERAWTMFWLGPVEDCWHFDDPDNLLIGVYGEIWVTVFTLKDRELMRGAADRGCWSPMAPMPKRIDMPNTMQEDGWLEKFEFIHLKLTPGTGVVVPSGAFHSLTMTDGDRILMNCFMVPKYKGLWDAPAANYSFYSNKWQSEEYHALAQLKKSSIFRLWDTKKLGGYFEGTKLEML